MKECDWLLTTGRRSFIISDCDGVFYGIPGLPQNIVGSKMYITVLSPGRWMNSKHLGGNYMKTFMANPATIERKWYVVDAAGLTLGRLSSEVAKILRGKNKPVFTPHEDTGDYVIIVNAEKIHVTGRKLEQKIYYSHSDYVGGMKETDLKTMLAKKPERVIELAVKGMLPKGPLGRSMIKKLFVYAGPEHKHQAQKPEALTF